LSKIAAAIALRFTYWMQWCMDHMLQIPSTKSIQDFHTENSCKLIYGLLGYFKLHGL
jgi:hypothetical protein